jgi:hypothetical protein
MDGTIAPLPTKSPYDPQVTEALTITNAFFADGGWLAPDARSTANGATLLEEAWVAVQTRPQLLFLCQWNEYAGQPSPAPSYVDIYNATFGNDMEPTSLSACGLVSRPDNAYCGGWGFRYLNILRGLRHILDADMRIVEQQSLLVVVKHPVPWLAVSRGEDLVVTFVTLGRCQNLGYFTILVDNSTSPISVPAKSMDDVQYAHTVSSSVLQALAPGWHELHVFGHKHDSQMCPASVLLSDDSLSLQSAHTRDKVRFQLF